MNDAAILSELPVASAPHADPRTAPASEFLKLLGLRIVEWAHGRCVVEIPIVGQLTNVTGSVSGAVVAAAVDMAAGLSGCWSPPDEPLRRVVTLSFTVAFMASSSEGVVRATAIKQGGGSNIFTSTVTVTSSSGDVLAVGQGTFRYIK